MKIPVCSVCQVDYDEDGRVPMMLQCGHSFCKECLAHMFSLATDHTLACPRCRQPTQVGNSVESLHKNFAVMSLLQNAQQRRSLAAAEEDSAEEDDESTEFGSRNSSEPSHGSASPSWPPSPEGICGGIPLDLGLHSMRLIRSNSSSPSSSSPGRELWFGSLTGPSGCRHRVAIKKLTLSKGMDLDRVRTRLDSLRRISSWCQNVCKLYGACEKDGSLCIAMERHASSIQVEMQKNEGRLTLEQILRYGADIARGVAELHATGIVCMNLKPSNLLLDAKGRAVVSDFNLPEILKKPDCRKGRSSQGGGDDCSSLVHSCVECTMLNPHYMAPEAWEPLKKSSLNYFWDDGAGIAVESDAWSFGCTLVEMCTGVIPWSGLNKDEIYKAVVKAHRQPPQYVSVVGVGIPRELWKMIGDCLQFKPSKRPKFHAMLSIFLRHLQELPLSPPLSPENYVSKDLETIRMEPSPPSVLEFVQDTQNELHRLVSELDVEGVKDLLARAAAGITGSSVGSLFEGCNGDGQTALHLATMRGCSEIVEAILEYPEADVDALDKDGNTPIISALASGTPDCLTALVKKGADFNAKSKDGLGPSIVHMCCFYGEPVCMQILLSAGADPNAVDSEGETLLHSAIEKKYTACATVILENGGCKSMGFPNSKELTPLHLCIVTANVAIVQCWVEAATQEEINEAIDITGPWGTALCMAAAMKKSHELEGRELVKILLRAGADPAVRDKQRGQTALHAAAIANDAEMVKIILDTGVDVDIRDVKNTTPLHVALARGSKACVPILLARGANCNLQDDEGDNALHIAADMAKMVRENLSWIVCMVRKEDTVSDARNHNGKTLKDFLEALPREWISEDLMDALANKGIFLTPTVFEPGDWVKFKRNVEVPRFGWQGATLKSVGFIQSALDKDTLLVSFCSGEARVLRKEIIKVIPLDRGQHVRIRRDVKEPKYGWRGQSHDNVGTVLCIDDDGLLRVGFPGASRGWKADPAEMERVEEYEVGDWVRIRPLLTSVKHGLGSVTPGSIGVVYSIRPDSSLLLDINYLQGPWRCEPEEVEKVEPFKIGDCVCVRRSVTEPRYGWGGETHHSVGKISEIGSNGLLMVDIPGRPILWKADPENMEKVLEFKVGDWVRVKSTVSSPKYGWDDVTKCSIGIVHSLVEADMGIGFCFRSKPFSCSITDMEKVTPFEVSQEIRISSTVTEPRLGWSGETSASTGKVSRIDMDGTLNVRVAGRSTLWKVDPGDAERLSGFEVGDWVRLKPNGGVKPNYDWHGVGKDSIAVVHSASDAGYLELATCFRSSRWMTHYSDVEKVPKLKAGQHVRFRPGLTEPRWGWRGCSANSSGVIVGVHADGEVRVAFPGLPAPWRGDPADLQKEEMFEVGDWVKAKEDLAEPKNGWKSLRPAGRIGVVQGVSYDGGNMAERSVLVGFCGEQERWSALPHELLGVEPLRVGQQVQVKASVSQPRFGWCGHNHGSLGTVTSIDADGRLRIHSSLGSQKMWMLDPTEVETVEEQPICIGDWVQVQGSVPTPAHHWGEVTHQSIGVVHKIDEEGELWVAFCFLERLWVCKATEMAKVCAFKIGEKVRIKRSVAMPRWGWGPETHASRGEVVGIDADGKLKIRFHWREGRLWTGDPADIELDPDSNLP